MLHLSVGALGGNTRSFSGEPLRQPHSMTLLECAGGELSARALEAPDFERPVPDERLPETISGPLGTLKRLDGVLALRP
jgi:hypothetical protein